MVVGLLAWIVGSYNAEVAQIAEHLKVSTHVSSLGNSMFFLGLVVPVMFLWPLPLLHGRKPYLLLSVSLILPLQIPQALSLPPYIAQTTAWNDPTRQYVICLLFFRSLSGFVFGFAFMNCFATLLDLFGPDTGACCRGGVVFNNIVPMEGQNQYQGVEGGEAGVRAGAWIGLFTWMFVGSAGCGYLFGKVVVARTTLAWGFWIVAILTGVLIVLVVTVPEVRPPWKTVQIDGTLSGTGNRRSISGFAESEVVERGEIKMVMFGSSPKWWWEEVSAGFFLSVKMMRQRGFLLVALYFGWIIGNQVLLMTVCNILGLFGCCDSSDLV
ncbi:hypothetical protein BZA77DRAFT_299532 [Pyronema omphalodes]|nr:hypothetical protein BZA77DRAFT_299532 [Pyronema omphalodes]